MSELRIEPNQDLPESEREYLSTLSYTKQSERARDLNEMGWSLRAIGAAFTPPRPRSTIHDKIKALPPRYIGYKPSHPLPPLNLVEKATYTPKKPAPTKITFDDAVKIDELAHRAKRFRASMSERHPLYAVSQELTALYRKLYDSGVPIQALADAAGVTYRAVAKRLGK